MPSFRVTDRALITGKVEGFIMFTLPPLAVLVDTTPIGVYSPVRSKEKSRWFICVFTMPMCDILCYSSFRVQCGNPDRFPGSRFDSSFVGACRPSSPSFRTVTSGRCRCVSGSPSMSTLGCFRGTCSSALLYGRSQSADVAFANDSVVRAPALLLVKEYSNEIIK